MKQISFIAIFLAILSLRDIDYILIFIAIISMISFKEFFKLSIRVIKSIFLFNFAVTLGYLIMAIFKDIDLSYLIYINIKVFSITYFVFWFFGKVNIIEFFNFNKDFTYLLTITLSQIYSYKKTFEDFRVAFKSRVIELRKKEFKFITNTFSFFFKKSLHDSKEKSLAMKSRGFFND